jgi:KDO2-lipid IV(A) lauroyltransferase
VVHALRPQDVLPDQAPYSPTTVNRYMEALIRRAPEQYLWGYHRYKQPRAQHPQEQGTVA